MDYFSLGLALFCLIGQSLLHMFFISRLTKKTLRAAQVVFYFLLLCVLEWVFQWFALSDIVAIIAQMLVLYSISRLLLGNGRSLSGLAAILAVHISQLSFGMMNSLEMLLFQPFIGRSLLYFLVVLATVAAFVLCAGCYMIVCKYFPLAEDERLSYVGVLLLPSLFCFMVELYILQTSYSVVPFSFSAREAGKHGALLVLQSLGLAALFFILYAYGQLCRSWQHQATVSALTQAVQAQKIYIAEAQTRYEQTKAFRHDIKNHLTVLGNLLNSGQLTESKDYLQKLTEVASQLSFPYQTGNSVVDILLGEKLERAKANGISADVSLILPKRCGVDDLDLCVIFANALDNAITACQSVTSAKTIRISGERQGDFYLLAFENTCSAGALPPAGTGLANIQTVAEKYHGAMAVEKTDRQFSLHVLLNIS